MSARSRFVFVVAAFAIAICGICIAAESLPPTRPRKQSTTPPWVELITIDGSINPATASYIEDSLASRKCGRRRALVIELDTPGGLLNSAREDRQGYPGRADSGDRLRRAVGRERRVSRHLHYRSRERGRDGAGHNDWRGASGGGGRRATSRATMGDKGRELHRDLCAHDRAAARPQRRLGRAGRPPQRRDWRARGAGEERRRDRRARPAQPADAGLRPQGPGRGTYRDARAGRRDGAPRADDARPATARTCSPIPTSCTCC